ncbi:MAG TPA: CPBP family intramembrane glutamic endopeptidase [Pseudonocardiaceae bacterium]|jgi:hypothetical protein
MTGSATASVRVRKAVTGVVCAGCLAAEFGVGRHAAALAALTYVAVLAMGRSRLPWAMGLPGRPLIRITTRVVVFFVPLLFLGLPALGWSLPGVVCGVAVAAIGLWSERYELRSSCRADLIESMPYESRVDRSADLLFHLGSGVAQEYLYRGLGMAVLVPLIGVGAIPVTAALFVGEHVAHPNGLSNWDRHDLLWQAFLGLTLGGIVYVTGSLPAAILAHTVYNAPNVVLTVLRPTSRPAMTTQEVRP